MLEIDTHGAKVVNAYSQGLNSQATGELNVKRRFTSIGVQEFGVTRARR